MLGAKKLDISDTIRTMIEVPGSVDAQNVSPTVAGTTATTSMVESSLLDRDVQARLAAELVEQTRTQGVDLVGPGGLLAGLTNRVLETALEAELTDHLGYEAHDVVGRNGGNSRNGRRAKTVLTGLGPVEIEVPVTGTGPSSRSSSARGSVVWTRSTRSYCR